MIFLRGTEEGRADDPVWIVPPSPLDVQAVPGRLSKHRREDLQALSFALTLSLAVDHGHPIEIMRGDDPPDRVVSIDGVRHAVELTELTVSDIRRDLADARRLGRLLHDELMDNRDRFGHLVGRRVALAVMPNEGRVSFEPMPLLDQLCCALEQDRGCVGDGVDLSGGLPEHWPNNRGFYGQYGPVIVMTYRDGVVGEILVSSSCQAQVRLSQALSTIRERIRAKDQKINDMLLITCGMPDEKGYVCPSDRFMFRFIEEHVDRIQLAPTYLKGVFLHLWGSADWIELFRSSGMEFARPPSIA